MEGGGEAGGAGGVSPHTDAPKAALSIRNIPDAQPVRVPLVTFHQPDEGPARTVTVSPHESAPRIAYDVPTPPAR